MDDDERSPESDHQPPTKRQRQRQRVLACRRCRHRKQKCEESRPCQNCTRSNEECLPMNPATRAHVEGEYVRSLEERIVELESLDPQQSLDHIRDPGSSRIRENSNSRTSASSNSCLAARAMANSNACPRNPLAGDEDDSGLDHLMLGLVASPFVMRSYHDSFSGTCPVVGQLSPGEEYTPQTLVATMAGGLECLLLEAYRDRAQAQYPFFHWDSFLAWHLEWKTCPLSEIEAHSWKGFFVNLVYATSLLLLRRPHAGRSDSQTFYRNGIALLPSVLAKQDKILHVQAYLLLAILALHQSSTERIISLASTTIRYCAQLQLHLYETEAEPTEPAIFLQNQIRRRCFWCAYKLDRLVMTAFDLPPSIPDSMITAKAYANIDDKELLNAASSTPAGSELPEAKSYTCVSPSIHILHCRQIQSEISTITLRSDYHTQYERSNEWRIHILGELEKYKSRVQNFSDPQSKGYTSQRWLAMIYHYTLLMLYRPTKESVLGPAGDWSVQASTQACLMFRKTQMDRQIAQPWLGLLVQFQSGITLLYCFWATPPEYRTDNYDSLDVSDALRACSNILAIMADRWAKADCLRDAFELLAREIPLVDSPHRPPADRMSTRTVAAIREKLPQVRSLVVHRSILRMIEQMITDDFPRVRGVQQARPPSVAGMLAPPNMAYQPFVQQPFSAGGANGELQDLGSEGLLSFPGVFDFDAWDT
ncbi:fungal-specific transcription factor domain-domain-containing protein [Clohesyomyces aquaticus]|uniref:Fungal-specific transcription factor domain-domain-containing protein n=1 Tax=Clohesyomyces aquaticus TaxID=1231657 RepID=A0A1Y1YD67_9PLEO|nr:fungal-specific transcription factor domain-domain-containing protein [Clohesyomyces aquaticus]